MNKTPKHVCKPSLQLPEDTLYDLADLFKVFGDSTRLRILCALFNCEHCGRTGYDPLGHFAPVALFKAKQTRQKPPGGENGVLLAGGRTRQTYF